MVRNHLFADPVLTFSLFSLFSLKSPFDDLALRFAPPEGTRREAELTRERAAERPSGNLLSESFSGDKALYVKEGAGDGGTFKFMRASCNTGGESDFDSGAWKTLLRARGYGDGLEWVLLRRRGLSSEGRGPKF
jgi:hypothetical protein